MRIISPDCRPATSATAAYGASLNYPSVTSVRIGPKSGKAIEIFFDPGRIWLTKQFQEDVQWRWVSWPTNQEQSPYDAEVTRSYTTAASLERGRRAGARPSGPAGLRRIAPAGSELHAQGTSGSYIANHGAHSRSLFALD